MLREAQLSFGVLANWGAIFDSGPRLVTKTENPYLIPDEGPPLNRKGLPEWPPGWDGQRRVKQESDIFELLSLGDAPHVPSRRRASGAVEGTTREELEELVVTLEQEMLSAAEELRFEYAARLRDEVADLRREMRDAG